MSGGRVENDSQESENHSARKNHCQKINASTQSLVERLCEIQICALSVLCCIGSVCPPDDGILRTGGLLMTKCTLMIYLKSAMRPVVRRRRCRGRKWKKRRTSEIRTHQKEQELMKKNLLNEIRNLPAQVHQLYPKWLLLRIKKVTLLACIFYSLKNA